jgi:hypothetical protein
MSRRSTRVAIAVILLGALFPPRPAPAQTLLGQPGEPVHVIGDDLAVLETPEPRKELPCEATPIKPSLGFDLRFYAGYDVSIALKELSGTHILAILFRVTPLGNGGKPAYFIQQFSVPPIAEDAGGNAALQGVMSLGEGDYQVDWLMRDGVGRVCSTNWKVQVALSSRDKDVKLEMRAGAIEAVSSGQFTAEPAVQKSFQPRPIKLKILANFTPEDAGAAAFRLEDTAAFVGILRRLVREQEFGQFSLVAFNLQEQRVFYRQSDSDNIDFPALGQALQTVRLGTVDAQALLNKGGDSDFLADLIEKEMHSEDSFDALVLAGPKVMLKNSVADKLKPLGNVNYPVFYINYVPDAQATPWRDSISRVVRMFKGTEFTIARPHDLWVSLTEMVSRITKSRASVAQVQGFAEAAIK